MSLLYRLCLSVVSRPALFPFWLYVRKLSAHALNMSAAVGLECDQTGEQIAFDYVLSKTAGGSSLVIFDAGANMGQFAGMCIERLQRRGRSYDIVSFEPASAAVKALRERFHGNQNVHIHQTAMGDESGEALLYIPWDTSGAASLLPGMTKLWPKGFSRDLIEEKVPVQTIDEFMNAHDFSEVHFLKIDVEGAELKVIHGARKAIEAGKIKFIQFEVTGGTMLNRNYLYDFWTELSQFFRFFLIMNQGLSEIRQYDRNLENFAGATNFLLELRQ